jgi:hypothetical protein
MKPPRLLLDAAAAGLLGATALIACSHTSHPQSAHDAAAPAPKPASSAAALPFTTHEPVTTNSEPMTPASGFASPRASNASGSTGSAGTASASTASTQNGFDQGSSIEDQRSIQEIREALASDRTLTAAASQITIVARDGRVTLRGQVNTAAQRAAIEKAARRAGGVIEVRNQLAVME